MAMRVVYVMTPYEKSLQISILIVFSVQCMQFSTVHDKVKGYFLKFNYYLNVTSS